MNKIINKIIVLLVGLLVELTGTVSPNIYYKLDMFLKDLFIAAKVTPNPTDDAVVILLRKIVKELKPKTGEDND